MATALDTNILVRLIARDDPGQLHRAQALLSERVCFIPDTVLLETAWVLRSSYGASRAQILAELQTVLGLPNVRVSDFERLRLVFDWYGAGIEIADAFHLASSQHADEFATFDARFVRRAEGKGACSVMLPPAPRPKG